MNVRSNNTCDIYRAGGVITSAPDVAQVSCFLKQDWERGQEAGDRPNSGSCTWTHVLFVPMGTDIRDGYAGLEQNNAESDFVMIPNRTIGTRFEVTFVMIVNGDKKVYLDRRVPPWPTNHL